MMVTNKIRYKLTVIISVIMVSITQAQELQTLIAEALKNNPQVQQFELKYKRITERKQEVNSLPNTELGVGVFASTPETRTGAQRLKISAKQKLPWFGTIKVRKNYITALASVHYEDILIVKRKLIASVSQAYYKLYKNIASQKVLEKNIQLLNTYEKLALTSLEVNKASAVDVLKLQIRKNEIAEKKQALQEQLLGEQATLNKLLNKDLKTTIHIKDELIIPKKITEDEINNVLIHPELVKFDKLYHSVEQLELLNRKEEQPLIGVGLDYINVEKRPNMNFSDNGKDIVMPMISVSIPIFNKKYSSVSKQYKLQQQEIIAEKQNRLNTLESILQNAIAKRNTSVINYNTNVKNLVQTKSAEQILLKSYETATIDFNDVLDVQELQLKFQLNIIASKVTYYTQNTIINYLIQ